MSPRVSIALVNWNGRHFLGPCLRALERQTFPSVEIVLVDNGSEDGSLAFVREHHPHVRVIANEENRGFAAANNQAIRATASEYVATINNDTEADPNWLAELVEVADADPKIGACASQMVFADRPHMINSAGIALDRAGIAWDRQGGARVNPEEQEPAAVFGACAGAALYRRAMLDDIGLFDETFFAYLEDVDLAWRAQWAGWRAAYVPTARVLHAHSGTAVEGSPFKNRLLGRNKVWLIAKNYPRPHLLWYLPAIILYDLETLPYTLIWRGDWQPLLGRLEGLRRLGQALGKWRTQREIRRVAPGSVIRQMASLASPWALWRRYAHLRGEGWKKRAKDVEK